MRNADQCFVLVLALVPWGCSEAGRGDEPGSQPTGGGVSSAPETRDILSAERMLDDLPPPLPGVWSPVIGRSPQPFWRRGEEPTYAPAWYANRSKVTHEISQRATETSRDAGLRLYAALQRLTAGDHLLIRAGTYNVDRWLSIRARGTEQKPIVIRGAPGETVIITRPDAEKNVIDIDQSPIGRTPRSNPATYIKEIGRAHV